ncbi:type II secretion system protein M [Jannaschia sp.]|nr:type II secretion system protein M [Jannaschia sp.]
MSARLIDALSTLSGRERVGLAALVLLALPLGVIFGVLLPLEDRTRAAQDARADAVALRVWVQERATEAAGLAPAATPDAVRAPIGTGGIERTLIEAGLRGAVSELSANGDGQIALRFEAVGFDALIRWLTRTEPTWGYDIAAFRLDALDRPGMVEARLTLVPPTE